MTMSLERREVHKSVSDQPSFLPRGPLWTKGLQVELKQNRVGAGYEREEAVQ